MLCDHLLDRLHRQGVFRIDFDIKRENVFVAAAEHGEGAMARRVGKALAMVEIVRELRACLRFSVYDPGAQHGMSFDVISELPDKVGVLGEGFGENIPSAVERSLYVGDRLGEIGLCQFGGSCSAIGEDCVCQGSKSALTGDLGAGPAFRPKRQINILELGFCDGERDLRFKVPGQFALAANPIENGRAPRFELPQIGKTLLQLAELGVIKTAGCLLTVARNEGHRGAIVEEIDCDLHLFGTRPDFGGDGSTNAVGASGHSYYVLSIWGREDRQRQRLYQEGGWRWHVRLFLADVTTPNQPVSIE